MRWPGPAVANGGGHLASRPPAIQIEQMSKEWPTGPAVLAKTPESEACHAASEAEVQRCLAAGMPARKAQIEGSKAAARTRRVQLGLEPDAPDPYDVPPKERLRFDKTGRRLIPPKKAR